MSACIFRIFSCFSLLHYVLCNSLSVVGCLVACNLGLNNMSWSPLISRILLFSPFSAPPFSSSLLCCRHTERQPQTRAIQLELVYTCRVHLPQRTCVLLPPSRSPRSSTVASEVVAAAAKSTWRSVHGRRAGELAIPNND